MRALFENAWALNTLDKIFNFVNPQGSEMKPNCHKLSICCRGFDDVTAPDGIDVPGWARDDPHNLDATAMAWPEHLISAKSAVIGHDDAVRCGPAQVA
jgi:hypothetical protein